VSALGFPLERTQISKIENGHTNVDVEKLLALAAALEVVPDRLLRDPEDLDYELFRRLRVNWRTAALESERYRALAELLQGELLAIADRLSRDDISGMTAAEVVDEDSFEIGEHRWVPAVARVAPESPGYSEYVEALAAGRGSMVYKSSFPALTPWKPKPAKKGSK